MGLKSSFDLKIKDRIGEINMINAWHLVWIIPLASFIGFFCSALLSAGKDYRYDDE